MSDMITITLNGREVEATAGEMLIAVADRVGETVPRFCYHRHLSVAANCRMCLVEVAGTRGPVAACATPVVDGMEVHTQSELAREAQRGTMEFLLINHPLDCPICDQGGECELQDLSLEYGDDVSRYSEARRVVPDPYLGPLVSTDMTRCIHCTRCVRFTEEIAGEQELGAFGRGEFVKIGTYIEKALQSELSGCVIDLCPVGALNARPSRMRARSWDLVARPGLGEHDGAGSHLSRHVQHDRQIRSVPRDEDSINESWLSDRDRFSYQAAEHPKRLTQPLVNYGGKWFPISWEEALDKAAQWLNKSTGKAGLIHPSATVEECFRFQQLLRARHGSTVESRLRASDFRYGEQYPMMPSLGCTLDELAEHDMVFIIGSYLRHDQPIINHRLRRAVSQGTEVWALNPCSFDWNFPLKEELVVSVRDWLQWLTSRRRTPLHQCLRAAKKPLVWLGPLALNYPDASLLYSKVQELCARNGATLGMLPEGANAPGAWLSGCVADRRAGSKFAKGTNLNRALDNPPETWFLYGVDPRCDVNDPRRMCTALHAAKQVIGFQSFMPEGDELVHDLLLPIATVGERNGHLINLEGRWQEMEAAVAPPDEVRGGVEVLEALASAAGAVLDVRREQIIPHLRAMVAPMPSAAPSMTELPGSRLPQHGLLRCGMPSLYQQDAVVRHAHALQQTEQARTLVARVHPQVLKTHSIPMDATQVRVYQGSANQIVDIHVDESMPEDCLYLPSGDERLAELGAAVGLVRLGYV